MSRSKWDYTTAPGKMEILLQRIWPTFRHAAWARDNGVSLLEQRAPLGARGWCLDARGLPVLRVKAGNASYAR